MLVVGTAGVVLVRGGHCCVVMARGGHCWVVLARDRHCCGRVVSCRALLSRGGH